MDILGDAGIPVGVLGWWSTWPAEKVNGFLCSEYTWPLRKNPNGFPVQSDEQLKMAARTWPPHLMNDLRDLLVFREDIPDGLSKKLKLPLMRISPESFSPADAAAKDMTYNNIAERLLPKVGNGFFTVYFESIDVVCHSHWSKYEFLVKRRNGGHPEFPRAKPEDYPLVAELGESIESFYCFVDSLVGELLAVAPDNASIIVVSDHGFADRDPSVPTRIGDDVYASVPHFHALDGVLIAKGPMFKKGYDLESASVLDVTPLILRLEGLPIAEDFTGHLHEDMFTDDFLRSHPPCPPILTYEYDRKQHRAKAINPEITAQGLEMLKSLGYIH
jgi:hypothetical protein